MNVAPIAKWIELVQAGEYASDAEALRDYLVAGMRLADEADVIFSDQVDAAIDRFIEIVDP